MQEHNVTNNETLHSIRIVVVDSYMATPIPEYDPTYSEFRGFAVQQVPVLRVFGSNSEGKKICVHVHGVFPYLYIPFDEALEANSFMYRIASSIDKAVNVSLNQVSSNVQHVYKVTLVSGIPMYGYHKREHQFLKIFLYNPMLVRRVASLLQNEATLGRIYQPHETHIPFHMQFMIDYNLHGMSNMVLSKLVSRLDKKTTVCELEADAFANNIVNRQEVVGGGSATNPGIAALWEDERQRRRNNLMDSQIEPCLSLDYRPVKQTSSHVMFKQALLSRLVISGDDTPADDTQNLSVYPSEAPEEGLLNASQLDTQLPSSWPDNSSEETFSGPSRSQSLEGEAQQLFDLLVSLEGKKSDNKEAWEESILSQYAKDEDDDLDLSMPFNEAETPVKIVVNEEEESSDVEDILDVTLVPQLDGPFDDEKKSSRRKKTSSSKPSSSVIQSRGVKRKLDFSLNQTLTEKHIACNLTPRKRKKENIIETTEIITEKDAAKEDHIKEAEKDKIIEEQYDSSDIISSSDDECPSITFQAFQSHKRKNLSYVDDAKPSTSKNFEEVLSKSNPIYKDDEVLNSKSLKLMGDEISSNASQNNLNSSIRSIIKEVKSKHETLEASKLKNQTTEEVEVDSKVDYSTLQNTYCVYVPEKLPPTRLEIEKGLKLQVIAQEPFYSQVDDVASSLEVGFNSLKVLSKSSLHVNEFDSKTQALRRYRDRIVRENYADLNLNEKKLQLLCCDGGDVLVGPIKHPPTKSEVNKWLLAKLDDQKQLEEKATTKPKRIKILVPTSPGGSNDDDDDNSLDISLNATLTPQNETSSETSTKVPTNLRQSLLLSQLSSDRSGQITGISFHRSPLDNYQTARAVTENQNLTIFFMELHVKTRGHFKPNPEYDPIRALFYVISQDLEQCKFGVLVTKIPSSGSLKEILNGLHVGCDVKYVEDEMELIEEFVRLMEKVDADIVGGWEIELGSWGYLIDRASILGKNLIPLLGRSQVGSRVSDDDGFGGRELKLTGRIVLDVWRLMRHEVALQSYTLESVAYVVLNKRLPLYDFKELSLWWDHSTKLHRHRTAQFFLTRLKVMLELFQRLDLIGRTSELSKLFGILFYEVFSRGSQFRVESMMLRLAKPMNYVSVSPSVQQRAKMRAPEFVALILEPESKMYVDPVIVLDFQSLYPSIIIAYNYCFTTALGRVENLGKSGVFEFGATQLKLSRKQVENLAKKDALNYSPCGIAFVKKHIRDGILPRMLREILDTRLMVKNSLKLNQNDPNLKKVLHNRQLGLKLIANVTYGYTSANFSGRMPAVEIADSVVSKGRETLQRAIRLVDENPRWGCRVVYGDTDSMFVLVPGKTRTQAFEIGREIADAVTADNPNPLKLKLEKVYQPCILQTKKRYVGYMYESPEQESPTWDAKGIETVRRDGCPAVSKILEKSLKVLFETRDVSLVKKYVVRQFNKILAGKASIQDLTFAKEYRGAAGYRPGACVPALELTRKWTSTDKRNEPRSGQRVPYVIINGPPGLPLIRLVRSPSELLADSALTPNSIYYITKVIIPPLNRCFRLIGTDLNDWYKEMPRSKTQYLPASMSPSKKTTISQYFATTSCPGCSMQTRNGLCDQCVERPQSTTVCLLEKIRNWERNYYGINLICKSCTGLEDICCTSLDCPVIYRRFQAQRNVQQVEYVRQLLSNCDFSF